jgi:AcrR family transcriptional regulator
VPRDASDTRARLLAEAERLFATRGIHQATTREILEAANQRNASAVTYHFGSRTDLLLEILQQHGDALDELRGQLVPGSTDTCSTRELVTALLVPYGSCLSSSSGRNYLRIVAQMTDQFALWRVGEVKAEHLIRILDALESRVPADGPVRQQRVVSAIMLMTTAMAERARQIEERSHLDLNEEQFLSDLADVIVAGLEAPVGPPIVEKNDEVSRRRSPRRLQRSPAR